MTFFEWLCIVFIVFLGLAYFRASLKVFTLGIGALLLLICRDIELSSITWFVLWAPFIVVAVCLNVIPLRQALLSRRIFLLFQSAKPTISTTEQEALQAGTVAWDRDLFTGQPQWGKLLYSPTSRLTETEKTFINGPCKQLCSMLDDWQLSHCEVELPSAIFDFIKQQNFLGLHIPQRFGGTGFSKLAIFDIIAQICSVSPAVGAMISVPNSLGPAELLLEYGTQAQQQYYLPRLAKGDEIPCFALTGPENGSDASSMPDKGIVCRGEYQGQSVIGIKLSFNKRYITLAPLATLIGVAFKLYDPQHLLGEAEYVGITLALIPRDTQGITIGRRHYAGSTIFANGPIQGHDIFIPTDHIIGGIERRGQGWAMLMDCLSAGRAITLPATVIGGAKMAVAATSAYSVIRRQFNLSIGQFEGVAEALARMAGFLYILEAGRKLTISYIDQGEKPAILSAMMKYHSTELSRKIYNHAMDIHAGKAICMGPKNYLTNGYFKMPIAITVEGANILTRSLIIFGQGAMRCHPYMYRELAALDDKDQKRGLKTFDKAIFRHLGLMISNCVRCFVLGISHSYLSTVPNNHAKRYFQQLTRYSAAFALLADVSMISLQQSLKRLEKISGRLGDILSMLYFGSAVLKQYHDCQYEAAQSPYVKWAMQYIFFQIQEQLDCVLKNFPNQVVARILWFLIFPLGRRKTLPKDELTLSIAQDIMDPYSDTRNMLIDGAFLDPSEHNQVGKLLQVLDKVKATADIRLILTKAVSKKIITVNGIEQQIQAAVREKILTEEQAQQLLAVEREVLKIIAVDDFSSQEMRRGQESAEAKSSQTSTTASLPEQQVAQQENKGDNI